MNIIVCLKQVPNTTKIEIDEESGALKRDGVESKMNPYDLYALQAAVEIKEKLGGCVTALTMGPPAAKAVLCEALMLGADRGVMLSDRAFAGADVLATSYTLQQGIRVIGDYSLILCGKQTVDGDTAQVGPAIAEHLNIPHISWVKSIETVTASSITVEQNLSNSVVTLEMPYPCLLSVETTVNQPRLPSYLRKTAYSQQQIKVLALADLQDTEQSHYGMSGSPTSVERIFPPTPNTEAIICRLEPIAAAAELFYRLKAMRFL